MKQVVAEVISNKQILKELRRRRRRFPNSQPRDILGSWLVWLRCPEIAQEAKPGQFVMVRCGGECILPRPFSIHQVNDDGIALFFAAWQGGKGTGWLSHRQMGDIVELFGPLGNGFSINSDSRNLLLVAGGIGIAPLVFLAQRAISAGCEVTLLQGASGEWRSETEENPSQLYPEELLPAGIKFRTITTDKAGLKGMVTDLVPDFVGQADQVFACGPSPMYRSMAKQYLLRNKSVQISLEVRMGCGLGVCYGCTVKTRKGLKQVCKDGPVFELNDIVWDELSY